MECLFTLSIHTDWKPKAESKHIVFNHLKSHWGVGVGANGLGGVGRKYYYTGVLGGDGEQTAVYRKVLLLKACILKKVNVFSF